MNIEELKNQVVEAKKAQQQHRTGWGKLNSQHEGLVSRLATLDDELVEKKSAKEGVVAGFVKGDKTKADIEKARTAFERVSKERDEVAEILAAVEKELFALPRPDERDNPFNQSVVQAEEALWGGIFETEKDVLRKALVQQLSRAYAASLKTGIVGYRVWNLERFLANLFDHDTKGMIQSNVDKGTAALLETYKLHQ